MKKRTTAFFTGRSIYLLISATVLIALLILGTIVLGPKIVAASSNPEELKETLGGTSLSGQIAFVGLQFLQVLFAFIPGEFIEIAAGYIYGSVWGTALCLIGVAPASFLIFSLTRFLGNKFTCIMIDQKDLKRLNFLNDEKKLTFMFFLLYFLPGTPKDLITYFAGVTKIRLVPFLLISVFGRIPSVLTSALAGSALGAERYWQSALIFLITGVIVIIGWLVFHILSTKRKIKTK